MGAYASVFILLWRKETTLTAVAMFDSAFSRFAARTEEKLGLITIIEEDASLPSNAARQALAQYLSKQAGRLAASAVIFEGNGFRSAMVRGAVTGITILARQPYPHRIFSSVEEGVSWLISEGRAAAGWDYAREQLVLAIRRFRESM